MTCRPACSYLAAGKKGSENTRKSYTTHLHLLRRLLQLVRLFGVSHPALVPRGNSRRIRPRTLDRRPRGRSAPPPSLRILEKEKELLIILFCERVIATFLFEAGNSSTPLWHETHLEVGSSVRLHVDAELLELPLEPLHRALPRLRLRSPRDRRLLRVVNLLIVLHQLLLFADALGQLVNLLVLGVVVGVLKREQL